MTAAARPGRPPRSALDLARDDLGGLRPIGPGHARPRRFVRPVDPRLLHYAAAARGYLVLAVVTGLLSTALILAQAGLLAHALASAALGTGAAALAVTLGVLLTVLGARALTTYGGEIAALRAAAAVKSQLRRKLTAHLVRLGPAWLGGQQVGELAALSSKGLDALDPYFARFLPQLVLAVAVPVAVLVRVALADWISALVIAVTLPLIPVFAVLVGLQTRARTERQWRLLARLGGHFLDVVQGLPTLKLFGRADAQADVIRDVTDAYRSATMATLRVAFLSALVLELSAAVSTALVAVEIGLRLLAGHVSYQTALLVLLLTPEAYLPLRAVGAQFHASMEGVTAAGRVCDILDEPKGRGADWTEEGEARNERPSDEGRRRLQAPRRLTANTAPVPPDLRRETIQLNAITLAYQSRQRAALDHVSCSIGPGERVAVTGPSGAGKSSLLALLLRFAVPTEGRITVSQGDHGADAVDIASVDLAAWRRQIAWVPQHPHLFEGTVASNIALGQPDATEADIARAAAAAGAAEFVEALPGGYAASLGERGARLSAGQRQRIALARAFLRDAPLLLLDEPVAHLDPITARQIMDTIERLMAGRTVLLVTHRQGWSTPGPASTALASTGLATTASRELRLDQGRLVLASGCLGTVSTPGALVTAP
jgi:ATP-binding cassette subfamily C protein CydD